MARERRPRLDDAAAAASALFLAGVLSMQPWLALPAGVARLAAFVERVRIRRAWPGASAWALAVARVGVGLALPLTVVVTPAAAGLALAGAAAVAGEILDRAHFYGSLEVTTPRIRMAGDLAAGRAEGAHA
jgi:hypothetical protein